MPKSRGQRNIERQKPTAVEVQKRVVTVNAPQEFPGFIELGTGANIVRLDGIDPFYRIWTGAREPEDATFRVNRLGQMESTAGSIGGWDIGTACLIGGSTFLDRSGSIGAGSSDDFVGLAATSDQAPWMLWTGASNAGSANFRVDFTGKLFATGASISGSIAASAGFIGGWRITGSSIEEDDATPEIVVESATPRINVGYVGGGAGQGGTDYTTLLDSDGIKTIAGSIGGWLIDAQKLFTTNVIISSTTGKFAIGANPWTFGTQGIQLEYNSGTPRAYIGDGANQFFQYDGTDISWKGTHSELDSSGRFVATAGSIGGWEIAADNIKSTGSNIEIHAGDSVIYVGKNTFIAIKGKTDELSIESSDYVSGPTGAGFHLSPGLLEVGNISARGIIRTAVFIKDTVSTVGGKVLILDGDKLSGSVAAGDTSITIDGNTTFSNNDILRLKMDAANDEWMTVSDDSGAPTYTVSRDAAGDYVTNPSWPAGQAVVNYGQSGEGGVFMDATETNAPFIQVFTHGGAPWSSLTEKARLGKLSGVTFGGDSLTGFGLWTDSGYFSGSLQAQSGCLFDLDIAGTLDILADGKIRTNEGAIPYIEMAGSDLQFFTTGATVPEDPTLKIRNTVVPGSNVGMLHMADDGAYWWAAVDPVTGCYAGWAVQRPTGGATGSTIGLHLQTKNAFQFFRDSGSTVFKLNDPAGPTLQIASVGTDFFIQPNGNGSDGSISIPWAGGGSMWMYIHGHVGINLNAEPSSPFAVANNSGTAWIFQVSHDGYTYATSGSDLDRNLVIGPNYEGARVYHNADQSLGNNTETTLSFNSEDYDTKGFHDNVTNNSRLTIPDNGTYLVGATIVFDTNSSGGERKILLRKNGATEIAQSRQSPTDVFDALQVSTVYHFNANDYVEVRALQDSGGNLDVVWFSGQESYPRFWIHRIGPDSH